MSHLPQTGRPPLPLLRRSIRILFGAGLALAFLVGSTGDPVRAQQPGGLSGSGVSTRVDIGGDSRAIARQGGTASNRVGSSDGSGGSSSATVRGSITTMGTGGNASVVIADPSRGGRTIIDGDVTTYNGSQNLSGNTMIQGDTTTMDGADLKIGGCGSTSVVGDVFVGGGSLEVGCVCAGRRNGQCCVVFHHAICVLHQVPPGKHGCPPGYVFSEGLCRLYSDFAHAYGK